MASPTRRWMPVIVWVAVIYTTIPFVRVLREWYVARWDPVWIGVVVAAVLVCGAGATLAILARKTGAVGLGQRLWVVATTAVFVAWTFGLRRSPEESVHFLEYGVLAILIHRGLRPSIQNTLVFVAGALIGSLVGTIDEIIQWITPSRFWDWRDLVLNGGAGALVQVILWRVGPPSVQSWDPPSLRIVLRLVAAQLVLLVLCLSNTPARVARYAPHLPSCDHLTSSRNPMAEYGHLHIVPGLGSFKSRLTLEEIQDEDEGRATEVAGLIGANLRQYGVFLDTWPVRKDPFTYEAVVHFFARNRNLGKSRERDFTGAAAVEQLTIAWSENRLLEEFVGNTLESSSLQWNPRLRQRVESAHDPDFLFRSAAGSHLITFASERTIRFTLLVLAAVMIVTDLRLGRRHGRPS